MKELKRNIALMLALCLVITGIVPAYAGEVTLPEQSLVREETENAEILHTQEAISDTVVSETDKDMNSDEVSSDDISYEDETILEGIKNATPANADYDETEETQDDTGIDVFEEATPANAKYMDEIFIRETVVDGITITLTADLGVFPEDAELWAEKVEDTDTEEAIEEAVEKERDNDVNVASTHKFDIKMFVKGEEVQPDTSKGAVKVTFTLAEELSECLDANAYHLKEDAKGKLTAENLGAEVKTVEEADEEETIKEAGDASKTGNTVSFDEDGVLEDGAIEDDVTKKVTKLEADTDGFSYYVVEFTYHLLRYTLVGSTTKLSNILSEFGITATPSEATVSNEEYLTVTEDEDREDWTVTVLQNFDLATINVTTVTDHTYEIKVSNNLDSITRQIVKYIDANDTECEHECIIMTSADGYSFESGGWYAVTDDVTIKSRIENNAPYNNPAHLVLADGVTLNVQDGIHNGTDKGLVITGQKKGTGKLIAKMSYSSSAAIGMNEKESPYVNKLTINGGTIEATAESNAAGIGGGNHSSSGDITINGGTIIATGGVLAAGIGGGNYDNGTITINGGKVTANGGDFAAGIGGGSYGNGYVEIKGGTVVANGGWHGSGIGSGENSTHSRITINGGTVTATGSRDGASIGRGEVNIDSNLLIYAGESRETAKKTDKEGVEAHFAYVSICTAYTVSHNWQTVDGTSYEQHESETLYGGMGWETEAVAKSYAGFTAQDFSQKTIASDVSTVVTILYNRNTCTITFDMNGRGTAPEPIIAVTGADIKEKAPQDPKAEGYLFEGWYMEKECTNPFTFHTMPENDMTLYAKWLADPSKRQIVQYLDEDGNTKEASCIILSTNEDSYVFDTGEWYVATGNVTINSRVENRASEDSPSHLILRDDTSLVVKGGIHNPDGNGLVIYRQSIGSGTLFISGVPDFNSGIGDTVPKKGGKITINGGTVNVTGGYAGSGIDGKTTINGGAVNITGGYDGSGIGGKTTINGGAVIATGGIEGAGIGGRYLESGGEVTINGGTVTATGGEGGAAIGGGKDGQAGTLVFGKNPGVLRAGSNKSDASDVDVATYTEKHQDYGFVFINYAKASYTVEHWKQKTVRGEDYQLDADATEILSGFVDAYAEVVSKEYPGYGEPQYTPKKITADGKTKIIAKYDLIYSTIFFDANGHGTDTEPIYATPGSAITAPRDPHAEGYIFEGWYTEAECTNKYVFITMPSEDLTLYAKWTPIKYTITWKDGTKVLKTEKLDYDTMPDYGDDPIKPGYEFLLWWPTVQKVTGDATYNAIFFKPSAQYTITWKDWDGKVLATITIDEGALPKYPGASKPSRSGYIFTGWTPEIDLAASNMTYTATYEKKSSGGGGGGGSGSGGGGSSAVIAYAEKPAVTPITVAANGSQMMGTAVVSIPAAQLVKNGLTPVPGIWSKANGMWAFTKADGNKAKNEWALITVAGGNASYFYFDSNGNMVTGWQRVGGKWMYFNNESGSLLGASLRGPGRTPDGYEIDATGAWTGR